MTFSLRLLPEVEDDAWAGHAWHESKALGLGDEFLRAFYAVLSQARDFPNAFPVVGEAFRRCLLRRFPYAVYFVIDGQQVIVVGLFHCARDPRAIRSALTKRQGSTP
jgi:plasmid stabilization system protein ParE